METYTHNLKIILVDLSGNIVVDDDFLDEIKNALCQSKTKKVEWNGQNLDVTIQWHRKDLNNLQKQFMGDLFTTPIYDSDKIIVNHTTQMISCYDCYNIKFYISRVIGNKTISKDSCGIVY